ncbi:3D domain-containing protein [Aneurinibacillus sp. REN35]|uniref:3D domain-containing protein n=1 Tax=Aneurinibacillus sp. REN35 TaxID=3237286 RepID=UPI003529988E
MKQNHIQSVFLKDRTWILLTAVAMIVLLSLALLFNSLQTKKFTFINDGRAMAVTTKAETLGEFLTEKGITPEDFDDMNFGVETALADGMQVTYMPGRKITINVAGQKKEVMTAKRQVKDILKEQSIGIGSMDKVVPALNETIKENQTVTVTRIAKKVVQNEKTVAFNTKEQEDRTMLQGQQKVIQQGQQGKVLERYEVVYINGKPASKKLVETKKLQNETDKIVAVGTARMTAVSRSADMTDRASRLSSSSKNFTPRQTLRVKMTAYSPHVASTGKNPGDAEYAITASGATATEGRTIAVDPRVVPLGWWVYIEGYGFRKAEDTGGAIKGNKMDLFFESETEAQNFGVQQKTVHVIGPNKPN